MIKFVPLFLSIFSLYNLKSKIQKFKLILKNLQIFNNKIIKMNSNFHLTINELPKTKKMQVDERHPLLKLKQNKFTLDEQEKINEIGSIYGSAMSMMIRHERSVLAEPERMPGLRSSFLSLQSNLGRLHRIEFEDVLNKDGLIKGPNAHELYLRQFS